MSELKPYPDYVNNKVTWLGSIPASWDVVAGKRHLRTHKEIVGDRHEEFDRLSLTMNGVIPRSKTSNEGLSPESFATYQILRPNELVFKMIDLENRKTSRVGLSNSTGLVSSAYIAASTSSRWMPRFAYYYYTSLYLQGIFNELGLGVRSTLNADDIRNIPILIPPIAEQITIVNYLDYEMQQIDAFVKGQEQLIALLIERRAAMITLETSGKFISDSPWPSRPLKECAKLQTGITLGKLYEGALEYPYLRVANVQAGHVDVSNIKTVAVPKSVAQACALQPGDVLMTEGGDRDKLGRGAIWQGEIPNCLHQNHIFAVRCDKRRLISNYLVYVLDSRAARDYFDLTAKQTTNLASTNLTTVKNFRFPLPPIEVQENIIRRLDRESGEIDAAISDAKKAIFLSKERRAALISATVTGKIDVRNSRESTERVLEGHGVA